MPTTATRLADVRFIGPVMGRYVLDSRRHTTPGAQRVFACRLQSISPSAMVASAPVVGYTDEGVTAHFEPFGTIRGKVDRYVKGGFGLTIECSAEERERLASKIDWYKKRTFAGVTDKREHKRFMPREPRSAVITGEGKLLPCLLIDMSVSGAAVSADLDPQVGEVLAVGKVIGRVVRQLEVGFAVRFVEPLLPDTVEEALRLPAEWESVMREVMTNDVMVQ